MALIAARRRMVGIAGRDWQAGFALSAATLFWSGNFIAGRALGDAVDPITLNTLRWGLALLIVLPWAVPACWRSRAVIARHWRLLVALGATGIAAFHTTVYAALTQTTATNALLVLALTPAAILLGSFLLGEMRLTVLHWLGSAVSLLGAGLLITRADVDVLRGLAFNRGDLWMLVAVALWAAYSLLLRRRPPELSGSVALAASMAAGLGLMLVPMAATLPAARLDLTAGVLATIGYIVVFPSLAAFLLWSWGVARIGPERAGQFVHLMPVFGPLLAMALLGERLAPAQGGGALVVFAGMAMVIRAGSAPRQTGSRKVMAAPASQGKALMAGIQQRDTGVAETVAPARQTKNASGFAEPGGPPEPKPSECAAGTAPEHPIGRNDTRAPRRPGRTMGT